jgi:hypothetical protein
MATTALTAAVTAGDLAAVAQCLAAFIQRTVSFASSIEKPLVDSITDAPFPTPARVKTVLSALQNNRSPFDSTQWTQMR